MSLDDIIGISIIALAFLGVLLIIATRRRE